jgi:hypothetical protein
VAVANPSQSGYTYSPNDVHAKLTVTTTLTPTKEGNVVRSTVETTTQSMGDVNISQKAQDVMHTIGSHATPAMEAMIKSSAILNQAQVQSRGLSGASLLSDAETVVADAAPIVGSIVQTAASDLTSNQVTPAVSTTTTTVPAVQVPTLANPTATSAPGFLTTIENTLSGILTDITSDVTPTGTASPSSTPGDNVPSLGSFVTDVEQLASNIASSVHLTGGDTNIFSQLVDDLLPNSTATSATTTPASPPVSPRTKSLRQKATSALKGAARQVLPTRSKSKSRSVKANQGSGAAKLGLNGECVLSWPVGGGVLTVPLSLVDAGDADTFLFDGSNLILHQLGSYLFSYSGGIKVSTSASVSFQSGELNLLPTTWDLTTGQSRQIAISETFTAQPGTAIGLSFKVTSNSPGQLTVLPSRLSVTKVGSTRQVNLTESIVDDFAGNVTTGWTVVPPVNPVTIPAAIQLGHPGIVSLPATNYLVMTKNSGLVIDGLSVSFSTMIYFSNNGAATIGLVSADNTQAIFFNINQTGVVNGAVLANAKLTYTANSATIGVNGWIDLILSYANNQVNFALQDPTSGAKQTLGTLTFSSSVELYPKIELANVAAYVDKTTLTYAR